MIRVMIPNDTPYLKKAEMLPNLLPQSKEEIVKLKFERGENQKMKYLAGKF